MSNPTDRASSRTPLAHVFDAKRIAILGRLDRKGDPEPVLARHRARYGDDFHLVNPGGGTYGDRTVYERLVDVPFDIEVAVISVGMRHVLDAIRDCGAKGVPFALVFTAGFSEIGPAGAALERELGEVAAEAGVRILGPNTNTNVFERMPEIAGRVGGRIGLVTQSGHNGRPLVQGADFGVAYSRWVPTGNELDVEAAEVIEFFAGDPDTDVVAGYIEGFRSMPALRDALTAANRARKPVVLLKVGSTEAGTAMASSHTGHLTGSDSIVDGLFAQHAVTRVRDLDELLETAALFAKLPAGTGPRACLYSISGGSGALMAEVAELAGVPLAELSAETQAALHEVLPSYLSVSNPVDNGGEFLRSASIEARRKVLDLLGADPGVDVIVIGITGALGVMTDNFAADIREWAPTAPKPVIVTWNSPKTAEAGFDDLVASRLPLFRSFRGCFAALADFARYQDAADRVASRTLVPTPDLVAAVSTAFAQPGPLGFNEAHDLLEAAGVDLVAETLADDADAAVAAADTIGYPVALKTASRQIPHRSESGLLRLHLNDATSVRDAYDELVARAAELHPDAVLDGVIVQSMAADGIEMIVGAVNDPASGPAVIVGVGGILAEVIEDVAVRPFPLADGDALEMVESLRGASILRGVRGRPPVDIAALCRVVEAVAAIAGAAGDRFAELDLNPVLVRESGVAVVDHLVIGADSDGNGS